MRKSCHHPGTVSYVVSPSLHISSIIQLCLCFTLISVHVHVISTLQNTNATYGNTLFFTISFAFSYILSTSFTSITRITSSLVHVNSVLVFTICTNYNSSGTDRRPQSWVASLEQIVLSPLQQQKLRTATSHFAAFLQSFHISAPI